MKAHLAILVGSTALLGLVLSELNPTGRASPALAQEKEAPPPPPPAPLVAPAKKADAAPPAAPPARPAGPAGPAVDETALRYFARQGDTARLAAETARLKALHPDWTPPADPLAALPEVDARLDAMWKLYAEQRYAALRKAISDRQAAEPGWQTPTDLLERLEIAESRERLVNASDLKQFGTVVRIGAETPALLTCGDVDVLWRVAEAFARTDRAPRALDAYRYVLGNCGDGPQRLATVQKALPLLSRADFSTLLALEKKDAEGKGEFEPIRDDLARQAVAAGGEKPEVEVAEADLARVSALAGKDGRAADSLLLGWYFLRREALSDAREWFEKARGAEDSAEAAQGLALALIGLAEPDKAEDALFAWRDSSDETRATYMAAVVNTLAVSPPLPLDEARLGRLAAEVGEMRDAAGAQQFGWYADALNQFGTAAQWFEAALAWKRDDEPSAYGLALMRWKLGDQASVRTVQRQWRGRSERIATVGQPERGEAKRAPARQAQEAEPAAEPEPDRMETSSLGDNERAPTRERRTSGGEERARTPKGCSSAVDLQSLPPRLAVARGWCLMELKRPLEAAAAFEAGLRSASGKDRADAAYGQSLAYLEAGLTAKAAVAAVKAPQSAARRAELRADLLSSQAGSAFEAKRYREAVLALDERARIAPEQNDLMIMRGYAYLNMRRLDDAERVFGAVAATGSREAYKGLMLTRAKRRDPTE